ncbi:peptidase T [Rhodobacter lacus]|uniref:Peptidase T n=1 Tax=Rhodobacter lacus TaxID=1641972 RepID=A0ABW5A314_9RHOB
MTDFCPRLEERLIRYCAVDTQSDEESLTAPSTAIQLDLANILAQELRQIGAEEVQITEYGAVLATVPATAKGPVIGMLAHMDTAPAYNATGVKPRVIRGYDGGEITYPEAPGLVNSPAHNPYLGEKLGHDLITASGATLLGADDKAGVAILMTLAEHLIANPTIAHGKLRLAFTPDEEIGRGVEARLPKDLGADFAYTLDGGAVGEIEYESFSADGAKVKVVGVSTHPGTAKGKMVNALHLAAKIIEMLPQATQTPEAVEGRDGFWHITNIAGTAAEVEFSIILRDFELEGLAARGALLQQVCAAVAAIEPRATITCTIKPQYRNMRYWIEKDMTPVELAREACRAAGITPLSVPIRGGTDGSRLTEMGVPCPNIFTGMQDIHGPLEWISVQDMAQATDVCLRLLQSAAEA